MKGFGTFIAKHLARFAGLLLLLLSANAVIFGVTFFRTVTEDYGDTAPRAMLEMVAGAATPGGLPEQAAGKLRQCGIWAMYLDPEGQCFWGFDLPEEVPRSYTVRDAALFSRGYIRDYPVFVWNTEEGLLVLGYPKDSYAKLPGNYYALEALGQLPYFAAGMLALDAGCLLAACFFSKRKMLRSTGPIVMAIEALADGKPVAIDTVPELSEIARGVNRASNQLRRQREARVNWIQGISHDIRTPLSMIMGYADQIAENEAVSGPVREKAEIVRKQSVKIRELVQDLNLVSRLEYDMQPLHGEAVRPAKLLRAYGAELLNSGLPSGYSVDIEIAPETEAVTMQWDARLMTRAIHNLVQNSIVHNPQGCGIRLRLESRGGELALSVADDGVGLSPETLRELGRTPRAMDGPNEGHGLGLRIVRQITAAHKGTVEIHNVVPHGCETVLAFHKTNG